MITLHPPQLEMVAKSRQTGKRAVLLQAPTGFGKSVVASYIVYSALNKGAVTWFIVPRRELVRQMAKHYNEFNIPYTHIAQGHDYHRSVPNVICSLNSLVRRLNTLDPPALAIIDETHYGAAALDKLIKWLKAHNVFIIGLSATPWKLSGQGLGVWYDAIVEGPSIRWLIDNNYLSEYRMFAPSHTDMSGLRKQGGDYRPADLEKWANNNRQIVGDVVGTYKKHAMGLRGITYTVSKLQNEIVCKAFNDAGVPAAILDGETPEDERIKVAKALATGEIKQIVNAELCTFGYDLAAAANMPVVVQCMSDVQPTQSLAKQMQKWGRALRYEGINAPPHFIFDHANNVDRHGFPCDERQWTLADREKRSKGDNEAVIAARTCPKCKFTSRPTTICRNCGFEFPIESREVEQVDGELAEIKARQDRKMQEWQCKTLEDWVKLGQDRGYHPNWAYKRASLKGLV